MTTPSTSGAAPQRGEDGPLVVVVNRKAGHVERLDACLAVLRRDARAVDVVEFADWAGLDHPSSGVVVAAGGDGTLGAVVQHLRRRGSLGAVDVGLLPLGTGNDLARTVGLPLDPVAAAAAVLEGRPRPLDLLVDGAGRVAVNAVHAGIGGLAAVQAAPLKPLLGRVAYRLGALWAGATARGWPLRVDVDGGRLFEGRVLLVGVGNGRTIGGGTRLWPTARPDDGSLDVVVVEDRPVLARVNLAAALRAGDPGRLEGVRTARGTRVTIEGIPIPENVDGEADICRSPGSWTVEPGAWRLLTCSAAPSAGG